MTVEAWYADGSRMAVGMEDLAALTREGVLFIFLFGDDGKRREIMRDTDNYAIWVSGRNYMTYGWDDDDAQFRVHSMDEPHGVYKTRKRSMDLPREALVFYGKWVPMDQWKTLEQEAFAYHG